MVEAARLCPSSVNMQPLKFHLVYEEEKVSQLQAQTEWARGLPEMKLPHPGKEPTAFIVICQDTDINPNLSRFQKDVGIVAQTMLLTAVEMGLGGIMIGNFDPEALKRSLDLPETIEPNLVVAFGKPAEDIILTDVKEDGNIDYYRDEEGRHYVPKRSLREIVLNQE